MPNKQLELTVLQPEKMSIYAAMDLRSLFSATLMDHDQIEVNLSNVTEIDSAGLQLMIALKNDALKQGKNIIFTEHSTDVMDFLELFNMIKFFGDPVIMGKK